MSKFLEEFKKFAVKGNVIDLAVAVVMGAAFGKIVSSFVADIITPLIGLIFGGVDFTSLSLRMVGEARLYYGNFIQNIFDFVVIALTIFMAIKAINKFKKKEEEKPTEPPKQEQLLTEIRDLLKNR